MSKLATLDATGGLTASRAADQLKRKGLMPGGSGTILVVAPSPVATVQLAKSLKDAGYGGYGFKHIDSATFGSELSSVRTHGGNGGVGLGASAFTNGQAPAFGTPAGGGPNHLLAHELAHVLQQSGPRGAK